jgi:hypothetical protein
MLSVRVRRFWPVAIPVMAAILVVRGAAQPIGRGSFARQSHELSEPGGSFDTDNLISNERSYLHVVPALKAAASHGAYIGVGPDQNFSYIAAVRPSVAYIIDVRRDNLLLHLLLKALFEISDTRADYLGHLFGRTLRGTKDQWRAAPLDAIVAQLENTAPDTDPDVLERQVLGTIAGFGMGLVPEDLATIRRFHRSFIEAGTSLKFHSFGRPSRSYYPTYKELLFETDRTGQRRSFAASEDDYQFVRGMQQRDAIIPVVGNLAGPSALAAIGRAVGQRGETVSAFYVSNVELYLFQNGVFSRYADTVAGLPRHARSLLIRSIFSGPGVWSLPDTAPGYVSASVVQRMDEFVTDYRAHKYLTYEGLIASHR